MLHDLLRPKPRNLATRSPATRLNCLQKISHMPPQIPNFQIVFVHTRRHDDLFVHQSTEPEILALIRAYTRFQDFWHILHAPMDLAHVETIADVT